MKRSNRILVISVVTLIIVGGIVLLLGGHFLYRAVFADDTIYAPGYSEATFMSVGSGATKANVLSVLGSPLDISYEGQDMNWTYQTKSGSKWVIHFDADGVVAEVTGNSIPLNVTSLVGKSRDDVMDAYGEPLDRGVGPFSENWDYSSRGSSDTPYTVRRILYDENGIVIDRRDYRSFD